MVKGDEPTLTSCPLMYTGMCHLPVAHKIKVKKSNKNVKWYSSYGVIVNFTDNARNVSSLWPGTQETFFVVAFISGGLYVLRYQWMFPGRSTD